MIVDDAALLRETLESFFRRQEGFDVVGTAATGHEALERVPTLKPDLILMDLHMPVMDGLEATRKIKEQPQPRVVIMFTLEDSKHLRAAAEAAGADGFVPKSGEMLKPLRATIKRAFPKAQMTQWR